MGKLVKAFLRRWNMNPGQGLDGQASSFFCTYFSMSVQCFRHLDSHREYGVHGHHRILKDHADTVTADVTHFLRIQFAEIRSLKKDFSGRDVTGSADKIQNRKCCHRFACTAFSYNAQTFSCLNRKTDIPQCDQVSSSGRKGDFQVLYFQKSHDQCL